MKALLEPTCARDPAIFTDLTERPTILCADGEPAILRLFRQVLGQAGYAVETVEDGLDAWEAVQNRPFSLLITSYALPRLNGLELARRIRSEGMDQPLILATSHVKPLLDADLSTLRFSAILMKPFGMVDLLAAVERAVPLVRCGHGRQPARVPYFKAFGQRPALARGWGLNE